MIIPNYYQATSAVTYSKDVLGKWCCSYIEEWRGREYSRYLHPDGWKRYTFWWDSAEEMERVFQKFNQSYLKVEAFEIENAIEEEKYWEKEQERAFQKLLDK